MSLEGWPKYRVVAVLSNGERNIISTHRSQESAALTASLMKGFAGQIEIEGVRRPYRRRRGRRIQ